MKNGLPNFDRILFTDLRPGHLRDKSQDWFTHLISELSGEPLKFKRAWDADFVHPINPMTKYYKKLIDFQYNSYYNHICSEMLQASTEHEKSFILAVALDKVIGVKLKEIAHEIKITKADPEVLKGDVSWKQEQGLEWETAFILHYLKLSLTVLYLNIQDRFSEFWDEDRLTADTLELTFFRGIPGSPGSIKQVDGAMQPMEAIVPDLLESAAFGTVTEQIKKHLTIENSPIVKLTQFREVEKQLKEHGILDAQGYFVDNRKESHKTRLAAVYRVMMDCGFFRKRDLATKQNLKNTDIRSFLDKYFMVDLKETFRKITPADVGQAKIKLPWLDRVR